MSTEEHIKLYLEETVKQEYFDTLFSRWTPLLQRIGGNTQAVQLGSDAQQENLSLRQQLEQDFSLAHQLLDAEHDVYRVGMNLFHNLENIPKTHELSAVRDQFGTVLKEMLNNLSVKEAILADWRSSVDTVSPNALRVYTQGMLSMKGAQIADVERLIILLVDPKDSVA